MEVFDANSSIVQFCVQNYKSNPRDLVMVFRSPESTRPFVENVYEKHKLDPRLATMASSSLVVLSGSAALFVKIPTTYIMHVRLPDWAEVLLLFNKDFTICELAYRLCESMYYYTVLPKGRASVAQADIDSFSGKPKDYVDYTFASKFLKLLKPKRMIIFEEISQTKIDGILTGGFLN